MLDPSNDTCLPSIELLRVNAVHEVFPILAVRLDTLRSRSC